MYIEFRQLNYVSKSKKLRITKVKTATPSGSHESTRGVQATGQGKGLALHEGLVIDKVLFVTWVIVL